MHFVKSSALDFSCDCPDSRAQQFYLKALAIFEKLGNERGTAAIYHQLGMVAQEQQDYSQAEKQYRKSLIISEKHNNEKDAAKTHGQLGILAQLQQQYQESGRWLLKAIQGFIKAKLLHDVPQAVEIFWITYKLAPPTDQQALKALWDQAGLGEFSSNNDE